ncbi:DNA repair photolyase [Parabacteroides sp. PF5-5]|uniref:SPL family radical SAM protein n=1 Tax=unclassified Parabacteroides TaxID=2649774 RepID=UPI002475FC31|nr:MULTISPECIES: radical SAM protein [unclassified Parabacteroides]MDH6303925.1 DNA repair photolyase [Parabacteroides sp. PH5-39]MDH6314542.1 DNA repair photolyase [Parabacteroides sp. PF5-13]MDH6318393.1 DNA repair photolyase [Parabacteroides sp. PH5-13]MDH6322314.1 DNA repair photolyase [Parabacteroides sp. PH5-8]MDH6325606.1 DNA repair photolyase [Parabacteroides sp. PH5-41]
MLYFCEMGLEVKYVEAKSILSKLKGADTFFGIAYNMNLYRGCQHGCIYCDTRSECYGIHDISTVSVKKNALKLLAKELPPKRKNRATIGTGSMNDPYMPLEKEIGLVRSALQLIARERFPVHIITKSNLVERDADILQDIAKVYAAVSFTITSADDSLSQQIEPLAPPSSKRFKAMEELAKKGIYTGVTLMPLLPFINDTVENITHIVQQAKDAGASYIIPMFGVTLRKGSREYFYQALDERFAGCKERYQSYFGDQYMCNSPQYKVLTDMFMNLTAKLGLDMGMRFYEPPVYKQQTLF